MDSAAVQNSAEKDALLYLQDQAYNALLDYREPVRAGEILGAIGNDRYSAKLLRHVLAGSPRFAQIDRRWDLEARYEDKQRPTERVLGEIIERCGHPMSLLQMAEELASVYERPADYYVPMLKRILSNTDKYFRVSEDVYAPIPWTLEITSDEEDEILFDNGVDEQTIAQLESTATTVDWTSDVLAASIALIDKIGAPASGKAIALFVWRVQGDEFDATAFYASLYGSPELTWLSDGRWATKSIVAGYDELLAGIADRLAEEIIEEAPAQSIIARAEVEEEVAPTLSLTIGEKDLEEVHQIVSAKGEARLPAILENIFEISPRDPVYAVAAEGLSDAMRVDGRFTWVGGDRWRMADTIPAYVNDVPEALTILRYEFETPEGESIDVELDDDGLEGGLATEIRNPLVQDVSDREPITEQDMAADDSARLVLTAHHKALGTFPLCRIAKSFLPAGPHLVELTFVSGDKRGDVWANSETDLVYDMAAWYTDEMPESGAVFTLVKTAKSGEYEFVYNNETDPLVFVAPNRVEELRELAADPRVNEMSTYDLMCEIMQQHRKGLPFVTLFTEVNIVRRTTRRLVASILSSYYAFYQRPKTAIWQFDEKKVNQGFKKAKRKYVRKG